MADRIYHPSAPPQSLNNGAVNTHTHFPPTTTTKPQTLNGVVRRPPSYPQPPPRRRRSCCCSCCLWFTFFLIAFLLLLSILSALFYVLYRPHPPSFSLTTLRISQFNLTPSNHHLHFNSNLTITVRNPNKKLGFLYDPMTLFLYSNGVGVGNGSFPAFETIAKNMTTALKTLVSNAGNEVDDGSADSIESDLKGKRVLRIRVQLDSKVRVRIGRMKTKKVRIRVWCGGIRGAAPTGKSATTTATVSDSKCKVHLRIKIWKWTF